MGVVDGLFRNIGCLVFIGLWAVAPCWAQLSGEELLDKAIAFHDPNGNWATLSETFTITSKRPQGDERQSVLSFKFPEGSFNATTQRDGNTISQTVAHGKCTILLNGDTNFSEEEKKTFGLGCDRAKTMRDYYTYLYGLPMKLKDPGTRIDPKVVSKEFKGKEYLVLKVTYDETVGGDTWYFYFDPETYAMEVYQFFHEESKNDGEYILLEGLETVAGIKMPKSRAWYYNKEDVYLGTDILSVQLP